MPAWGVAGGGPKNEQAVSDLVAYLKSIQISPAKAKAQATKKVAAFKKSMAGTGGRPRRTTSRRRRRRSTTAKTDAQRQKYQGEIHGRAGGHHPVARRTTRRCRR